MKGKKYQHFLKRIIDLLLSFILLFIFTPISFITAVLIKLDSPGPVFADVPERIGENGSKFKMYKFRSMVVNAHFLLRTDPRFKELFQEYKKSSYKLKKDPRITRFGKFIRKHSIDEIPQLINVIKGEMSWVGLAPIIPMSLRTN